MTLKCGSRDYALRGLKEGLVDAKTVMRISDIETLRRQGVVFSVFDPIERYKNREELRNWAFKATGKWLYGYFLENFVDKLMALPRVDRWIMEFTPSHTKVKKADILCQEDQLRFLEELKTVSQVTQGEQKVNIFGRLKNDSGECIRLFASLSLFDLVIQTSNTEGCTPNPVFGISSPNQIELNGHTRTRDVCHLYLVPDEKGKNRLITYAEADGYQCVENDFNEHDRYHTFVASYTPFELQIASLKVAQVFKKKCNEIKPLCSNQDYKAMLFVGWQFKDLDYAEFAIFDRNKRTDNSLILRDQWALRAKTIEEMKPKEFLEKERRLVFYSVSKIQLYLQKIVSDPKTTPADREGGNKVLKRLRLKPFKTDEMMERCYSLISQSIEEALI